MKRLIINADDLGADEGRNEGIFEAIRAGVVTSASILPNGPALDHALGILRSGGFERVSFGVHLNLTEGRPLAAGLSGLTGSDGNFLGKAAAHWLLMKTGNASLQSEIAKEISAQIAQLCDAGIEVTHVDGHQHVHVFPAVITAALEGAGRHGIRWMRIPDEEVSGGSAGNRAGLFEEALRFSTLGKSARRHLEGTGIRAAGHFRGLLLKGCLSVKVLSAVIEDLPDGLTELMVHPGRTMPGSAAGPFSGFSTADREGETEVLLDAHIRTVLEQSGVVLTSYSEAGP